MPILDYWQNTKDGTFPNYPAGSQGPASSERMLAADGDEWRKL
jgi:glucose-6-phosphate 1-dehydrogenase